MSTELFHNHFRIETIRARWHDYNIGAYFVTICTKDREHYFGEISDREMRLSKMGMVADECMRDVHNHFPHVDVPLYVIMPDHVHAIFVINAHVETQNIESQNDDIMKKTETQNFASQNNDIMKKTETQNFASLQKFGPQSRNLASVVRGFKIGVKKYATENNIPFAWQTRFYDRIIRNQDEMDRVAKYIDNNVANWQSDHDNKL